MGTVDDLYQPVTEDEAADAAVRLILKAAVFLSTAADLAEEGSAIDHYVNASIHLRDLVNSLSPEETSWPKDGAIIYDIRTKERVN